MIKTSDRWTFSEHQCYAKGLIDGAVLGVIMINILVAIGFGIYALYQIG